MPTARRTSPPQRRTAIADAAIALLAAEGSRRLTHRAVDQHLNLPEGSTSAYFRTRASLLTAAAYRLAELDRTDVEAAIAVLTDAASPPDLPQVIAALVNDWATTAAAPRQLARIELQLESRRSPELAQVFAEQRAAFGEMVRSFVAAPGLTPAIMALVDGLIVDRLLYPRTAIPADTLAAAIGQLLSALG